MSPKIYESLLKATNKLYFVVYIPSICLVSVMTTHILCRRKTQVLFYICDSLLPSTEITSLFLYCRGKVHCDIILAVLSFDINAESLFYNTYIFVVHMCCKYWSFQNVFVLDFWYFQDPKTK